MSGAQIAIGQPTLGREEADAVARVMRSGRLTQGREVLEFERRFAEFIGSPYAVAVSNGTSALHLALEVAGIGLGDEVIVPASTFVASVNAITYTGATPVIVDVEERTWCLGEAAVLRALTPRTRAIMPVHILGAACDMTPINAIASFYNLLVVEDAAEGLGTSLKPGQRAGTSGLLGCFSFYGNKTITTGEGGMVVTPDAALDRRLRQLRGQGQHPERRYWHHILGFNYRMTELQAAVGSAQMDRLAGLLERRAQIAEFYRSLLGSAVIYQETAPGSQHGHWAMGVRLAVDPTWVALALAQKGVETRPMFPPVSRMPMYLGPETPVADALAESVLMLPMHADLTDNDVAYVAEMLLEEIRG